MTLRVVKTLSLIQDIFGKAEINGSQSIKIRIFCLKVFYLSVFCTVIQLIKKSALDSGGEKEFYLDRLLPFDLIFIV